MLLKLFSISMLVAGMADQVMAYPQDPAYVICDAPVDPCAGRRPCTVLADQVSILVKASGDIYVNGEKVTQKVLRSYVRGWLKYDNRLPFEVSGEKAIAFGLIASMVQDLRKMGARQVSCSIMH